MHFQTTAYLLLTIGSYTISTGLFEIQQMMIMMTLIESYDDDDGDGDDDDNDDYDDCDDDDDYVDVDVDGDDDDGDFLVSCEFYTYFWVLLLFRVLL